LLDSLMELNDEGLLH